MREFQKKFTRSVVSQTLQEGFQGKLIPAGRLNLKSAFEVYAKGYVARLTEALGEIFEGVWWAVGDKRFMDLTKTYILETGSNSYNLSDFGAGFPDFISLRNLEEAPFLSDLAKFEWLFHEVFHSAPSREFDHSELNILQQRSDVYFDFQPHLRLLSSPFLVYELWKHRKESPEQMKGLEWDLPSQLILYKMDQSLFVQTLSPEAFHMMDLLVSGLTLEEAVRRTARLFVDLTEDQVSQFFGDLVKTGVISGIRPKK